MTHFAARKFWENTFHSVFTIVFQGATSMPLSVFTCMSSQLDVIYKYTYNVIVLNKKFYHARPYPNPMI